MTTSYYGAHIGPPPLSDDELRLQQLDALIEQARRAEEAEARRRAEEEERRRAAEAKKSYSLEELQCKRDQLAAQILERQTHLQADAERDAWQRRADRLAADIEIEETKLAARREELQALMAKLEGLK